MLKEKTQEKESGLYGHTESYIHRAHLANSYSMTVINHKHMNWVQYYLYWLNFQ